ncbi:cytochrome P450 9e2 [Agrilus planipennis]|uniref:Cytochrome P450 9e2 n=1 Tax=Agrilus planipennis TaxID=224129 RepID=A0A1W4XUQ5_AGRPL|nr:cytochrome P450 9e2 [Agrilus planipennis]
MLFLLIFAVLVVLYYLYIKPFWYWESRNVPYQNPVPLFGNMFKPIFKKEQLISIVQNIYTKCPDSPYFGFINFITPILIIKDPELIKKITVKDFDVFSRHRAFASEDMDPLWSKNLFAIQDFHKWRHLRATLSPAFTASKLRMMFDLMQECAKNFVNYYLQKTEDVIELDVKDACRRFATDVIATTAFGVTCDSLKNQDNKFYLMGKDVTNFEGIRALKIFVYNSCPKLIELLRLSIFGPQVTNFFTKVVSDTVRLREEQNIIRPDMIHLLMEARKGKLKKDKSNDLEVDSFAAVNESEIVQKEVGGSTQITDEEMTAQALIFFFGGFDTSSSLMSFTFAELAVNPDIQKKLYDEINEVSERTGGKITYDDIHRMKYLDMVTSESLRKWTQGVFLDREAVKPYTIPRDNGQPPLKIEKGDLVWIPAYSIHRDPKYFPEPEKFDPERFSYERKNEIKPFTYLPFGAGPRNCIGSRFALLESKIAIFNIILNFEVVPTGKVTIPLKLDSHKISPTT